MVRNARSAPERNEVVQIRYHVPSNRFAAVSLALSREATFAK